MACTVNINFKSTGKQLTFKNLIELSDSPMLGIAQALFDDEAKREQIISSFNKLYKSKNVDSKQIGNISYTELSKTIPIEGGWPVLENIQGFNPDEYNILYIDKIGPVRPGYQINPTSISVGENKSIKVITLYRNQLNVYRNWLLANIIVGKLDDNAKFSKEFEEVQKALGRHPKIIFNQFLQGELKQEEPIKYGHTFLDIESVVENELLSLQDKISKRKYQNEFFNALVTRLKSKDDKYSIQISVFNKLASDLIKDTELLGNLKKIDADPDMTDAAKSKAKIKEILTQLLKTDKDFPFRISSITKDNIIFNRVFLTINEKYGLTLEKIKKVFEKQEEYKGFDVYKYNGKYYYTKGPMYENTKAEPYMSIGDIHRKINQNLKYEKLNTANIKLKTYDTGLFYIETGERYETGSLIKSLSPAKSINIKVNLSQDEVALLNNGSLQDFYNYIQSSLLFDEATKQRILDEIDTPEKAAIFLYKTNEIDNKREQNRNADAILTEINESGYRYYFVAHQESPYRSRVIAVDIDDKQKVRISGIDNDISKFASQEIPKAQIITEFAKAIQARLEGTGFKVELLTQKEISKDKRFSGIESGAKAFIKDQSIIINTTTADISDPLHEYAHIFLGLIKAQDFKLYKALIYDVLSRRNPREIERLRKQKQKLYEGMANIDIDEEIFADIYSKFIMNNHYKDFIDHTNVRKIVTKESSTIWDMLNPDSQLIRLGDIWNEPLSALVNLNSDMLSGFQIKGSPQDRFKVYRQASNWIRSQINDKKIIEDCK